MKRILQAMLVIFISSTYLSCSTSDDNKTSAGNPTPVKPVPLPGSSEVFCAQVDLTRRPLQYCYLDAAHQITRPNQDLNVIYFFHGLNGDVDDLFGDEGKFILDGLTRVFGEDMPVIVSLSLGPSGVMGAEANEISQRALRQIETTLAPTKIVERSLVGVSMGGHNALRLGAEQARQFGAVAALCPALATFNGYNEAEVQAYRQRNAAVLDLEFFNTALTLFRQELPTDAEWTANNPFTLMDLAPTMAALRFSCRSVRKIRSPSLRVRENSNGVRI